MPNIIREDEYRAIKKKLWLFSPLTVSRHFGRHLATVTKIAASKSFEHYKVIVRAEHPPTKNSLAGRFEALENRVAVLEQERERDKTEKVLELNKNV